MMKKGPSQKPPLHPVTQRLMAEPPPAPRPTLVPGTPLRQPWWPVIILAAAGVVAAMACYVALAHAGGPATIAYDQPADCVVVTGWELAYERAASAGSEPTSQAFGASIPNSGTCGAGLSAIVQTTGVGLNRFWLRAVALDGTKSGWSLPLDAPLPFASPVLRGVSS